MPRDPDNPYVSRGGLKLRAALDAFDFDVAGLDCADFGCSTGGFTDCLLKAAARSVIAIDTAYGALDYTLRTDDRVTVMERTNALHADPPAGGVDLVVADAGWTPQRLLIPAALKWLHNEHSRIITLIKPHYEAKGTPDETHLDRGVLPDDIAERIANQTAEAMPVLGAATLALTKSPIAGSKGKRRGNTEYLALLKPVSPPSPPGRGPG